MRHRDGISAVFFLVLALVMGLQAVRFPMGGLRRVGPGFFPLLLAIFLGLLSLILLVNTLRSGATLRIKWPARWTGLVLIVTALFVYAFLLNPLGFLTTTFLFTFAVFKYADPGRSLVPLAGSLLTTGLSFVIFRVWLAIPFPSGYLGY